MEKDISKSTVFVIDDQAPRRSILHDVLKGISHNIEVKHFDNEIDALLEACYSTPDIILTDYKVSVTNGVQLISQLRNSTYCGDIPIIAFTVLENMDVRYELLEAGVSDFLVEPIDRQEFAIRVRNLLVTQKKRLADSHQISSLQIKIEENQNKILAQELETLHRLAKAGEYKCNIAGSYLIRMGQFTDIIAEAMDLTEQTRKILEKSSTMHDIGKIGVPDSILMKQGPLSKEEFNVIKTHPSMGYEILKNSPSPYLQMGATIALQHHEKFDGSGYPAALKGEEISIEARIATVADVFDALLSVRPYKKTWPLDKSYEYMRHNSGTHFDPQCVDALFAQQEKINQTIMSFS